MNDRTRPKTQVDAPSVGADVGSEDVFARANPTVFSPINASAAGHASRPKTQLDVLAVDRALYSPRRRPATARLDVLDDGSITTGEIIRIRKGEFTIGRKEGDLVIEHDLDISGRHATLKRITEKGRDRWVLQDLNSTNGTFVRVSRAPLSDGSEILLGEDRYRIEIDSAPAADAAASQNNATRMYQAVVKPGTDAIKLRLKSVGNAERQYEIGARGATLGADQSRCEIAIADNCLSTVHAKISFTEGKWLIEDLNSLNGIWLCVRQVYLEKSAEFQLGEQRFRFYGEVRFPT